PGVARTCEYQHHAALHAPARGGDPRGVRPRPPTSLRRDATVPRYADTLLADGERIALRTRQHWFATIVDGRVPWALFLASLILLALTFTFDDSGVRTAVGYIVAVGLIVSLA